ncbi:MAG: M24 family metallopeptidase [Anaerolineales bacterium]
MSSDRLGRLRRLLREGNWSAAAFMPGPNLYYLTGLSFHFMERPVLGFFPVEGRPRLIVPLLEQEKARASAVEAEVIVFGEDEASRGEAFRRGFSGLVPGGGRVAIEPLRLRVFELGLIESVAPGLRLVAAAELLADLRARKEADEVEAMRRAVQIAQIALEATLPRIRAGMTERELATELTLELYRGGSDPELPFAPIVASGPNSALPHAVPSDRRLQPGDLLIVDWGASVRGYFSDLTRTFAMGDVEPELESIHRLVAQANLAGRKAVRPGAACASVDAAARSVIESAGYGGAFPHRTGHGLGLEAHEPPYLRGDNPLTLEPGMTFTVEPGIYLSGRGGVRIEDNLVVTEAGAETLTDIARDLRRVG